MKKLLKMSLLVLVPLVSGLVLLFVGGYTENETFTEIGNLILKIGMPVTIFILVVVGTTTKRKKSIIKPMKQTI